MVKTRLIPVLFIKNGLIVRSEDYGYHQIIGNLINEAHRYNEWNVDELIYIDISRSAEYDSRRDDHKIQSLDSKEAAVKMIASNCFMPLTFGGGIRTIHDVDFLIKNGADKITLNSGALIHPALIRECAQKYGSQAVVLSVDYKNLGGKQIVFSNFGQNSTGIDLFDWIKEAVKLGAGEVMIADIERDGKACGYDIQTIGAVTDNTSVPVIACAGAGDPYDFVDLAKATRVSGIAAGNWFHFVERSYPRAKDLLKKNNIHVR